MSSRLSRSEKLVLAYVVIWEGNSHETSPLMIAWNTGINYNTVRGDFHRLRQKGLMWPPNGGLPLPTPEGRRLWRQLETDEDT